jgi:hypothetical protein
MDFNNLRSFLVVARKRSFSRGAAVASLPRRSRYCLMHYGIETDGYPSANRPGDWKEFVPSLLAQSSHPSRVCDARE